MNAIGLGGKICPWATDSTEGSKLREIRMVTATGEIEQKSENKPLAWRVSGGGGARQTAESCTVKVGWGAVAVTVCG